MVPFIQKYQPDQLEDWVEGKDFDLHPGILITRVL